MFRGGLTGVMMLMAGVAVAQEVSYPPLVSDMPPGYDLQSGSYPVIAGIAAGMTRAEVEAALSGRSTRALDYRDDVIGIRDPQDGREAAFRYRHSLLVGLVTEVPDSQDSLTISFTTDLTGGRVKSVSRRVEYMLADPTQMPGFDATMDALVAAYGQPTVRDDIAGGTTLYFVYRDGAPHGPGIKEDVDACRYLEQAIFYNFTDGRVDRYPECTALIEVDADRDYRIANALISLRITASYYRRAYDDAVIADDFLKEQIAAAAPAGGGPQVKL